MSKEKRGTWTPIVREFPASDAGIVEAVEAFRAFLTRRGMRGRECGRATLAAEESITSLVRHASEGAVLRVSLRCFLGTITAEFSAQGEKFEFGEALSRNVVELWSMTKTNKAAALRQLLLRSFGDILKYRHTSGVNAIRMTLSRSSRTFMVTMGALLGAIVLGFLMPAAVPADWIKALDGNVLIPVKTIYMNALKMIAAPVVFFSIVGSFAQQGKSAGLGRIGGKIIGLYTLTTVIAVTIGIGAFQILRPGDPSVAAGLAADVSSITSQSVSVSIKDMIVGIVPDNFLAPFFESNMLQLIFLSVICGIAVGQIGDYSKRLTDLFEACGELFLKIAKLVMRITPIAVFCAILSMVLKTGPSSLLSVLGMVGTFLLGLVCMVAIYCLILAVFGINPLQFLRKYAPTMLEVFSIASSNAAITVNIEACKKKLGISSKVYSLSIPLGATINMDGTSILLAVQALMLAQIYGVPVAGNALFSLAVSILLMSVGAPGVPGAGLIILSMLLTQLGIPVEGVALFMGTGPFVGMFICMCNCLGDVVVTTAVAKSEKLMDMRVFQRKS